MLGSKSFRSHTAGKDELLITYIYIYLHIYGNFITSITLQLLLPLGAAASATGHPISVKSRCPPIQSHYSPPLARPNFHCSKRNVAAGREYLLPASTCLWITPRTVLTALRKLM